MPDPQYKQYDDPTIQVGDTVIGPDGNKGVIRHLKDKWGRPSDSKWYGWDDKSKIYTQGPKATAVSDTIKKIIKPMTTGDLSGTWSEWDFNNPRTAVQRPGTVLDKQDISKGVTLNLNQGYDTYVKPALTVSLDLLESLESTGAISKQEIYDILSPGTGKSTEYKDPLGYDTMDEWVKKYDPDYFKGTIYDKNIYKSVKAYKNAVAEQGADFFLARTNVGRRTQYDKNGKPIMAADYGTTRDMLSTIPQTDKDIKEENYTMQVINKLSSWIGKNSGLDPVKNAMKMQDLVPLLTAANTYALNMQDVKDFRIKAKSKIVSSMYNGLKDRKDIKEEFGKPVFDKNNKFVKYNMDNLRFQLDKSFDEAGNFDPYFIPKTNYEGDLRHKNYYDKKLYGDSFKPIDLFSPHKGGREGMIDPSDLEPWQRQELASYKTFDDFMGAGMGDIQKRSKKEAIKKGYPIYTDIGAGTYVPDVIPYSETGIGELFADEFQKAVKNIYTDTDDRNVLGLGYNNIPFLDFAGAGGTGISADALSKKIRLSAGKNSDALVIWNTFLRDWDNGDIKNKINGNDRLISFHGAGTVGYNESLGEDEDIGDSSEKGIKLINDFIEWIPNNRSTDFGITAYKYAVNSFDKSAMVLNFPPAFLKSKKEDKTNGYLTDTDIKLLEQHGASIIGNQGDFSNELMLAQKTPLQTHIDYRKKFTWTHPTGLASYEILKGKPGEADYKTITRIYGFNEDGSFGKILSEQRNSITNFRDNIDKALNDAVIELNNIVNEMNN